uniref:Uncharacterized protein n=1 Tax=Strongyloides stercoralis TaxID=6248 RepID=A0AAF5I325_STRER
MEPQQSLEDSVEVDNSVETSGLPNINHLQDIHKTVVNDEERLSFVVEDKDNHNDNLKLTEKISNTRKRPLLDDSHVDAVATKEKKKDKRIEHYTQENDKENIGNLQDRDKEETLNIEEVSNKICSKKMKKGSKDKKRPNPDDTSLMPIKKVKVEKDKEIETLSDEMDKKDIEKSQHTVEEESSNSGDSNDRCHLERIKKITYNREESSPDRISSTSIEETEEKKTNISIEFFTDDSDEENVGSSYFEDEVLESISSTEELSSLEQSWVSSKINTSVSVSDVSDISNISLSNNGRKKLINIYVNKKPSFLTEEENICNSELNSDIREHARNKQIKKIFNVFASMYKGFTAFKNSSIDYQNDIKEIMKLEGETLKDKVKYFLNNKNKYIEKLREQVTIEINCPEKKKEELEEVFYSFIGLNMVNINCRVCSPCKPSSHLRKVQKSKSDTRKRYFFIEFFNKEIKEWTPIDIITGDFKILNEEAFRGPNIFYMLSIGFNGMFENVTESYTKSLIFNKYKRSEMLNEVLNEITKIYNGGELKNTYSDDPENISLLKHLQEEDFQENISDFKNDEVYCLENKLKENEIVWPPETQPIGEVRNYHIYSRKSVKKLYTPEQLFEKGRVIKENEKPLKYIFETFKSEDYADLSNSFTKPLYGKWQTKKWDSGFS